MRIHDNNIPGADSARIGGAQSTQGTAGGRASESVQRTGDGDHVSLSGLAAGLSALDPSSPQRQAYLERLQSLVADGRYSPNPETVADNLIEDALSEPGAASAGVSE